MFYWERRYQQKSYIAIRKPSMRTNSNRPDHYAQYDSFLLALASGLETQEVSFP